MIDYHPISIQKDEWLLWCDQLGPFLPLWCHQTWLTGWESKPVMEFPDVSRAWGPGRIALPAGKPNGVPTFQGGNWNSPNYPLVFYHSYWKSPWFMGKLTINGPFSSSLCLTNYQRVKRFLAGKKTISKWRIFQRSMFRMFDFIDTTAPIYGSHTSWTPVENLQFGLQNKLRGKRVRCCPVFWRSQILVTYWQLMETAGHHI